jgi:hypothetical protein
MSTNLWPCESRITFLPTKTRLRNVYLICTSIGLFWRIGRFWRHEMAGNH